MSLIGVPGDQIFGPTHYPPSVKPRLRLVNGKWQCVGRGAKSEGYSPRVAYLAWTYAEADFRRSVIEGMTNAYQS